MIKLAFVVALVLVLTDPAEAAPDAGAQAAYVAGDYARAVELARKAGGAEDLALAARAVNAVAYFDGGRKAARRIADEALGIAEEAVAADASLPEAHLQAAIALGLKGARMSPVRALVSGLAGKVRDKIDAALALDSENPWALSTSGAWRIEVARRGGGSLYGADPVLGRQEFLKARALAPENPTIAFECALRLLADGRAEWRAEGLAALDGALAATPTTKFEADVIALAQEFETAIKAGPKAENAFIARQP
jgi:hypothetical protein